MLPASKTLPGVGWILTSCDHVGPTRSDKSCKISGKTAQSSDTLPEVL